MVQFDKMTFFLNISSYDTTGNVDKNNTHKQIKEIID